MLYLTKFSGIAPASCDQSLFSIILMKKAINRKLGAS
jgi:hypothetical protein